MILLPQDHASGNMCGKDLAETEYRIRMYGQSTVQTDSASHTCLHQQCTVRKDIIISGNVQVPFFALHPMKDLIFCILSSRHDQWISFYVIYGYRFFICKLMILPDKNPPGFLLGKPDIL